jgi:hypothetical protein
LELVDAFACVDALPEGRSELFLGLFVDELGSFVGLIFGCGNDRWIKRVEVAWVSTNLCGRIYTGL